MYVWTCLLKVMRPWTRVLRAFGNELNSTGLKTMDTIYNVDYTNLSYLKLFVLGVSRQPVQA